MNDASTRVFLNVMPDIEVSQYILLRVWIGDRFLCVCEHDIHVDRYPVAIINDFPGTWLEIT